MALVNGRSTVAGGAGARWLVDAGRRQPESGVDGPTVVG
jgi:hypothetical protein